MWLDALVGGGGWLAAYLLRLPVLIALTTLGPLARSIIASILAGIFEEGLRYLLMRVRMKSSYSLKRASAFGLGWGLTEALLIFCVNVPLAVAVTGYGWLELMPGAVERNIAIIFHVAASCIIAVSLATARWPYMLIAVGLHSGVNMAGLAVMLTTRNPWVIEGVLALIVAVIAVPTIIKSRKVLRERQNNTKVKIFGWGSCPRTY